MTRHAGRIASRKPYKSDAVQGWGCSGVDVGEAVTLVSTHRFCCGNFGCLQIIVVKGAAREGALKRF